MNIASTIECPFCEGATGIAGADGETVPCPVCSSDGPCGDISVPILLVGWNADEVVELGPDLSVETETRGKRRAYIRGSNPYDSVCLSRDEAKALHEAMGRFLARCEQADLEDAEQERQRVQRMREREAKS